jgi:molybdopterin molybdotransferase
MVRSTFPPTKINTRRKFLEFYFHERHEFPAKTPAAIRVRQPLEYLLFSIFPMIPFRDALDLLLTAAPTLPSESLGIESACGRVLRQEIHADRDFPPFDRVMMDGFAMRAGDFASGREFRITGTAPAGSPAVELSSAAMSCVEVMTGAPLPLGADCIVPVEEITNAGGMIRVSADFEVVPGRFVHTAGSDARAGELLLEPGILLGSREIGVAASCGEAWIEVSKLPRIHIFATGDELVAVDETPQPHQIRQSNASAIACALQRAGHPSAASARLRDDPMESALAVRSALEESDWLIITGAVSKGARDFVPALLDSLGCRCLFHGVAQRPGKPAGCWIGPVGQVIMALPGNPVSALTGLHAFVLPALAVASGLPLPKPRLVIPAERFAGLSGMTHHLPVTLGDDGRARPAPTGNSGDFIGLLKSDGFVTLPPRGGLSAAHPFTPWL